MPESAEPEWRSAMVDLSEVSLTELADLTEDDESALGQAVRRLADDLAGPGEPIAGFNSAL